MGQLSAIIINPAIHISEVFDMSTWRSDYITHFLRDRAGTHLYQAIYLIYNHKIGTPYF
jgi:hypothetical protein